MSKVGIVAYIITVIFAGFCFWVVGCADNSTEAPDCTKTNDTTTVCGDTKFNMY